MKNQNWGILFLMPVLAVLGWTFLLGNSGCTNTPAAPVTVTTYQNAPAPTPFCSSTVSQGVTTAGSLSAGLGANNLAAGALTLTTDGTVVSLSLDMGATVGPRGLLGLYADNGSNQPGNLIEQTTTQSLTPNSWNNFPLPSPVFLPSGTYWVALLFAGSTNFFYNSSGGSLYYQNGFGWGQLPGVFPLVGTGTGSNGARVSAYANLCALPPTYFTVTAPASATAGSAFAFTVTAFDQFNNVAAGYSGPVTFTSSDPIATLPANGTLTNGVETLFATLKTAGSRTVTASDLAKPSISGTTGSIVVSPAAATHFLISAPGVATHGSGFTITVTALDQFNNTATGYAGQVHFTTTSPGYILPADSTLTNGVGSFSCTLNNTGNQTITGTDTVSSSITGTSNNILVN